MIGIWQGISGSTGYQSPVHYNESAAAPWFRVDNKGNLYEVWFEDPRSLLVKFRLVRQYGLAGNGVLALSFNNASNRKNVTRGI
jgi:spore germination protein